jgi:hypothetical protein
MICYNVKPYLNLFKGGIGYLLIVLNKINIQVICIYDLISLAFNIMFTNFTQ